MTNILEITVPDIGDFQDVEIIEVLVSAGDRVEAEDPLLTLESDKATMDVPSPNGGVIKQLVVKVGDRVSAGTVIASIETIDVESTSVISESAESAPGKAVTAVDSITTSNADIVTEIVVLGSGPGGYTAAFRAADLGKQVVLVERYPDLGGVCLNVGCIPSKALLHSAKVISDAREMGSHGIQFGDPVIDLDKLRSWKLKVVGQLTGGLAALAKKRNVKVAHGTGRFASPHELVVESTEETITVRFEQAIIAAGSRSTWLPMFPNDPRIFDSTGALNITEIPKRLLVIGGGIIGLEMATVYHELGARVTVVELLDSLMVGADPDIVKPFHKRVAKQYENIYLKTKVTEIIPGDGGLTVTFEGEVAPATDTFDQILVSVGRQPNGQHIGAELAGVAVDEAGFIAVDKQQRTNVPHIFAIGDIVGQPMLAHKASHEGKVAAEVAAGLKSGFDAKVIPSVAYTDPEIAWVGLTETEAKQQQRPYAKGSFPWAASGRALSLGRSEGITKLIFDESTHRVLGAGIVGPNAGDLIAEVALAIEMGCDAEDIGLTVHPHPTLSETVAFAAEMFAGTITDLYLPKPKR
ncbi:MAG: dihydrolipoyl dehydrogenase [Gammaproteobacteria bacterium]|nr:dihydrolipoyl dehydrogenase [Gammaproteobacteria bacterium]MDH3464368.1 dihydrolipoyl dehydrogenase [Gammaproteobacteria bacterium]